MFIQLLKWKRREKNNFGDSKKQQKTHIQNRSSPILLWFSIFSGWKSDLESFDSWGESLRGQWGPRSFLWPPGVTHKMSNNQHNYPWTRKPPESRPRTLSSGRRLKSRPGSSLSLVHHCFFFLLYFAFRYVPAPLGLTADSIFFFQNLPSNQILVGHILCHCTSGTGEWKRYK